MMVGLTKMVSHTSKYAFIEKSLLKCIGSRVVQGAREPLAPPMFTEEA